MNMVCLDLEGVLIPEIWIAFSEAACIPELRRTTRDEPDYNKLMNFRIDILKKNNLKLPDIQKVISLMEPLSGAVDFVNALREKTRLIILSDTFEQFTKPLMKKLSYPALFCNSLIVDTEGNITGFALRQTDGKKQAVKAFKSMNMRVFTSGDSYNDLAMIRESHSGCLFRAPDRIKKECEDLKCVDDYDELLAEIEKFLN
ncbi:MAG: bifunctional phosphoserine phosphatase/homoserine phosphotransferase ThrH [Treponema sp.]|nr:bifunctional phosphoserine phosphatase/homoserine phosphotransferase ThrH [Treponema sp.]